MQLSSLPCQTTLLSTLLLSSLQLSSLTGQSTLLTSLLMSSPQLLLLRLSTLLLRSCSPYQDQPYLPRSPLQLHTTGSSQLLPLVRMS